MWKKSAIPFYLLLACGVILFAGRALVLGGDEGRRPLITDASVVSGVVRGEQGQPISGARVRVMGGEQFTITDEQGDFRLVIDDPALSQRQVFVTAGKEGWFNNGARSTPFHRRVNIVLLPVPNYDSSSYQTMITSPVSSAIASSRRDCGNCHTTHLWEWGSSRMGKTVKNTKVLDMYNDFRATTVVQPGRNTCADCHAPIAALRAPGNTDLRSAFDGGNLSKGIECDFCHKIKGVTVDNKSGVQSIAMTRMSSTNRGMMSQLLVYGPYDDTVNMPMAASYNPLYTKSEFCSPCHQDGIALAEGKEWDFRSIYPEGAAYPLYEQGKVIPNQWTYQEWLEWQDSLPADAEDKGRQCQDCHMNWTKNMVPYYRYTVSGMVRRNMGVERSPKTIFPHKFQGATPERLTGSVNLDIDAVQDGGLLRVKVKVTNVNAGHRLPTGEHTRNMILLVVAEDEKGNLLEFVDGSRVPEWAGRGKGDTDYAGRPGHGFARITANKAGVINVPIWQAEAIVSDNRIKAKETDESSYLFSTDDLEDLFYVTATLIYRKEFPDRQRAMGWDAEEIVMKEKTIEAGDGGL